MTAKEKQLNFIRSYLKPALKQAGYRTSSQTWWKDKGTFYTIIKLQNFSWNSKENVDFRFNIGVALKIGKDSDVKDPAGAGMQVFLTQGYYLPDQRKEQRHHNKTGYFLTDQTDLDNFTIELATDLEQYILPSLEKLNTLQDCLDSYGEIPFWGDHLKRVISDNNLEV